MSGLVKGIKKVFKKVGKFVKKYWKYIAIAVAVYFTAGVALSYFGSTAAFSSAMPGFGVGGFFSKAAVAIGFQGSAGVASGLSMTSGAFAAGTAAAGTIVPAGTLAAGSGGAISTLTPVAATSAAVPAGGTVAGTMTANAAAASAVGTGTLGAQVAATSSTALMKAATTAFKLQAASTLVSTIGGLFQESESETYEKEHKLKYGNAFGVGRDGSTEHGWASTGGSDAFGKIANPSRPGDAPAGGIAPSQFSQPAEQAPFLAQNNQPQAQQEPVGGGQDFIQQGYQNKGYMPYA